MIDIKTSDPSSKAKEIFFKHGAVCFKGGVPIDAINFVRKDMEHLYRISDKEFKDTLSTINKLNKDDQKELYRVYRNTEKMAGLSMMCNFLIPHLEKIYPNKRFMYLTGTVLLSLPGDKRLTYDWHQEANFVPVKSDNVLTAWFPLFSSTNKAGPMEILLGSQDEGTTPYNKIKRQNGYTELVPENIDECIKKYTKHVCNYEPGDVVFFDKNMMHSSSYNESGIANPRGSMQFVVLDNELLDKFEYAETDY